VNGKGCVLEKGKHHWPIQGNFEEMEGNVSESSTNSQWNQFNLAESNHMMNRVGSKLDKWIDPSFSNVSERFEIFDGVQPDFHTLSTYCLDVNSYLFLVKRNTTFSAGEKFSYYILSYINSEKKIFLISSS
jgi:hypothetical protein